jgi:hypothetical protein
MLALGACAPGPGPGAPADLGEARAAAIRSVDDWAYLGVPGVVVRTENYRLFTTVQPGLLLERAPNFLEAALARYTSALAPLPPPPGPLDTFLMGTRSQWSTLTRQLMGEEAATYLRIQRGGFASGGRAVLYAMDVQDTLAIAAHEGWHQYAQRTFRLNLPVWLDEGVATYMEGFRWNPQRPGEPLFLPWANVERFDQLRAAAWGGGLMPLPDLLDASPERLLQRSTGETLTYYAQAWALTHFLAEGDGGRHRRALERLLAGFADGSARGVLEASLGRRAAAGAIASRRGRGVFLAYFDADIGEASRAYERFVADIVRTGARDRIVGGLSPVTAAGGS